MATTEVTDTAVTDSAVTDAAVTDSAVTDSAVTDSAVTDTAVTDAAVTDGEVLAVPAALRGGAVTLWVAVGALLGYGVLQTVLKAAALFG